MNLINLNTYVGRKVMRLNDTIRGEIISLGNYDDDEDLEFEIALKNGETVMIDATEDIAEAGFRFI